MAGETDRCLAWWLTSFNYLVAVNFAGQRGYNNFIAYLVVLRVLAAFASPARRNLALPVEIATDYASNHKDGVSHPLGVASLLVHLAPFAAVTGTFTAAKTRAAATLYQSSHRSPSTAKASMSCRPGRFGKGPAPVNNGASRGGPGPD